MERNAGVSGPTCYRGREVAYGQSKEPAACDGCIDPRVPLFAPATACLRPGTTTASCTVSYLLGQGGKEQYAVDIGGNFLCIVGSGACRCIRNRRLDLVVFRNLDHLSDRATLKWPRARNTHSPAEDVSRIAILDESSRRLRSGCSAFSTAF